eukprot:1919256-Rhodomonas_salina.1
MQESRGYCANVGTGGDSSSRTCRSQDKPELTSCAEMRKHQSLSTIADMRVRAPRGRKARDAIKLSRRSLECVRVKPVQ